MFDNRPAELAAQKFMFDLRNCIVRNSLADPVLQHGVDIALERRALCVLRDSSNRLEVRARLSAVSEMPTTWLVHFGVRDFSVFSANIHLLEKSRYSEFSHLDKEEIVEIKYRRAEENNRLTRRLDIFASELFRRPDQMVGNISSHELARNIKGILIKRLNMGLELRLVG